MGKSEVSTVGPCGEEAGDQMVSCAHLSLTLLRGIAEEQSEVVTGNHLVRGFLTTWPLFWVCVFALL